MIVKVRLPRVELDNTVTLQGDLKIEDIKVMEPAFISIDGSTSTTGVSILRESDGALMYCMAFIREREAGEEPVRYKIGLKRSVETIIRRNPLINRIVYEEPFIGHITAVANLMMLRTFVEELLIENEPEFNYITHYEINNQRWKRLFLAPDKVPPGTANQEMAVRAKLLSYLPFLKDVTQDEIESIAMGFVIATHIKKDSEEALQTKKKHAAFGYNIRFIGAYDDEGAFMDIIDVYNGPESVAENGITFTTLKGTDNFKRHIYDTMAGEDRLLVLKFNSDHHGNVILEHKIGSLAATFPYIYALVWRKSRKKYK